MKFYDEIKQSYLSSLYGIGEQLLFKDLKGEFKGKIQGIENTGELLILDNSGNQRKYSFKEIEMIQ